MARFETQFGGCLLAYQSSGDFCRFHQVPFGDLARMAQAFSRRVLALFLQRGFIEGERADGLLCCKTSGFSLDASIVLRATDPAAMERPANYMSRPPIYLSKVILEGQGAKVLCHTSFNPYFGESLKLFAVTNLIAELASHIPPKGVAHTGCTPRAHVPAEPPAPGLDITALP